ncbi:MAG: hypothetical protein AAGG01_21510 [Planctomycetota bacterium]
MQGLLFDLLIYGLGVATPLTFRRCERYGWRVCLCWIRSIPTRFSGSIARAWERLP